MSQCYIYIYTHTHTLFWELFAYIFCPFFPPGLLVSYLVICKNSLYVLRIWPLAHDTGCKYFPLYCSPKFYCERFPAYHFLPSMLVNCLLSYLLCNYPSKFQCFSLEWSDLKLMASMQLKCWYSHLCWEAILHASLAFLHILQLETLTAFDVVYLFKDVFRANCLGR